MMDPSDNPFSVTKATDFTDEQIMQNFVDLPGGGGFHSIAAPNSVMPMLILGGKGSGRTHLIRYLSYPLQKLRAAEKQQSVLSAIASEKYLGIFLRCEGLNSGRFAGKGQTAETWDDIFAYYMDLSLAQLALSTLDDALSTRDEFTTQEAALCAAVADLFDSDDVEPQPTIGDLIQLIRKFRREIDNSVNNAAITRSVANVAIRASRGKLVFGIPEAARALFPQLKDVLFLYLIDEFENITAAQQKYVNTLLREKPTGVSFKVGSRLYGIRTLETLSAGEQNHEGSEFAEVFLDEQLREDDRYPDFAKHLVARRLISAGIAVAENRRSLHSSVAAFFVDPSVAESEQEIADLLSKRYSPNERPYFRSLRQNLLRFAPGGRCPGVKNEGDADQVISSLLTPSSPLLEKASIFLLYQEWAARRDLVKRARAIGDAARQHLAGKKSKGHAEAFSKFRSDLLAQLIRDTKQPHRYLGIDTFIKMSGGLPRHLLTILKYIYQWAVFNGEQPFRTAAISADSQRDGSVEASNWFYEDARTVGAATRMMAEGVDRLATLFRAMRFSDKPVDPSLTTFSYAEGSINERAVESIARAREASLLLRVPSGRKDKNSMRVDSTYQLNPMLSPRFELPIARRGVIALSGPEVNAIFGAEGSSEFDAILEIRRNRVNAPFEATGPTSQARDQSEQPRLPGIAR